MISKILLFLPLLLCGCATSLHMGMGYDFSDSDINGVVDTDTETVIFHKEVWSNPVGIVGLSYPITEHLDLEYRHISSLGGEDLISSDTLSVILTIGGSREGWGQ